MNIKKSLFILVAIAAFSLSSYAQAAISCSNLACTINFNSTTNDVSSGSNNLNAGLTQNVIFSLPNHFWIIQPSGVTGAGQATALGMIILGEVFNGTTFNTAVPGYQVQFIAAGDPTFNAAFNALPTATHATKFSPQDPQNSYSYIGNNTTIINDKNWNISGSPATVVFTLIQAPEPSTWLFLGSCLAFIAVLHRFRREKALIQS